MSINVLPIFEAYPVLSRVPVRLQGCIRSELRVLRADDGQEVFRPGDPCTEFPLIVGGRLRVLKPGPDGRTLPLYTVGPGEFCVVSVSCLFDDVPYPAAGTALGEVVAATLPKALFHILIDEDAGFRKGIFSAFSKIVHSSLLLDILGERA